MGGNELHTGSQVDSLRYMPTARQGETPQIERLIVRILPGASPPNDPPALGAAPLATDQGRTFTFTVAEVVGP